MKPLPATSDGDLGSLERQFHFRVKNSAWMLALCLGVGLAGLLVGVGVLDLGGGRPESDDRGTMRLLGLFLGGGLLVVGFFLLVLAWMVGKWCLVVFSQGLCLEKLRSRETFRWEDLAKVVWTGPDIPVACLCFKSGRKVYVNALVMEPAEVIAFLRLLRHKVPSVFTTHPVAP